MRFREELKLHENRTHSVRCEIILQFRIRHYFHIFLHELCRRPSLLELRLLQQQFGYGVQGLIREYSPE